MLDHKFTLELSEKKAFLKKKVNCTAKLVSLYSILFPVMWELIASIEKPAEKIFMGQARENKVH